jgi:nucleoside-diphosphate-sugar epimerase
VKYVFHLAAAPEPVSSASDVYDVQAVNVEGTVNLLHAAVSEGVWRLVLGSCSSVYGTPATCPVSEDAPLEPTSLFGASKVAAESYCHAFHVRHQLDTVVLRYFTVYGPRQRLGPGAGLIANVIDALRRGRPFVDQEEHVFNDLTYVDDVVAATLVAARAPRATGRVINVGSGSMVGIGEIQGILAGLLKASVVPGVMRESAGLPSREIAETRLAAELLDLAPRVALREGLARMVRWLSDPSAAEEELAGARPW